MTCDFCTSPIPAWLFMVPKGVHEIQRKAWAACDRCAILIQNNDRAGLAKRAEKISKGASRGMSSTDLEFFFRHRSRQSPVRIMRFQASMPVALDRLHHDLSCPECGYALTQN